MKYLAFIALCAYLAASTPQGLPTSRLTGQFSGLNEPSERQVDLRLRFFARRSGGHAIGERRIQSVNLHRGRFSVAVDLTDVTRLSKSRRLYVEIGLRPAGRRYAGYTPVGPRRALRMDADLVWRLERPLPALAAGRMNPPPPLDSASESTVSTRSSSATVRAPGELRTE